MIRFVVFILLFLVCLPYCASLVSAGKQVSSFLKPRTEAYRYLSLGELIFVILAGVILLSVYAAVFTGALKSNDFRGTDVCVGLTWIVIVGSGFLFGLAFFQILTSSEGISFTALGRAAFHTFLLLAVVQFWSGLASISLTKVVFHSGEPATNSATNVGANAVVDQGRNPRSLYVVVHGLGGPQTMDATCELIRELDPAADIIALNYLRRTVLADRMLPLGSSNWDAFDLSKEIELQISQQESEGDYSEINLIGHSAGAVLIRKAYLIGCGACSELNVDLSGDEQPSRSPWTGKVKRIVMLAGLNRGIQISGQRPSDMSPLKHFGIWLGVYVSEMAGVGKLVRDLEAGAPLIANLRLDWIAKHAGAPDRQDDGGEENQIEIIQILGDIDDIVSFDDSHDLAAVDQLRNATFKTYKMTGTGHNEVVEVVSETMASVIEGAEGEGSESVEPTDVHRGTILKKALGFPRRATDVMTKSTFKLESAIDQYLVKGVSPERDATVDHVVIVLHGIRDYGRWSSSFVDELAAPHRQVENPRYGYFGMGSFLIGSAREKFVKWLMDEITELRSRYPSATFDFVGHSNGTYLFAKAIQDYESLKVRNVVFAGSVVNHGYDWARLLPSERGQVKQVVNITADKDWVVAIFPRAFEAFHLFGYRQPIGAGGYVGFAAAKSKPAFVTEFQIHGQHSAFHDIIPDISEYLSSTAGRAQLSGVDEQTDRKSLWAAANDLKTKAEVRYSKAAASPGVWGILKCWCVSLLVFCLIAAAVVAVGIFFVQPARQYSFQVAVVYTGIVIWLLQRL